MYKCFLWTVSYGKPPFMEDLFFFQVLNHLVTKSHGKIIPPNQIQRLCRMTHALVGTILQQLNYYAIAFPHVIG